MNNKIVIVLLVTLMAVSGFLLFQNIKLNKKVNELSKTNGVKITPVNPELQVANQEQSPFDKPNTDPLADKFNTEQGQPDLTSIKFEKSVHDFGKLSEGEVVKTVFKFINTGKNPLVITQAQGSCGCTVPEWPSHPVKAGGTGEISVQFNSADKKGEISKTVTVTANTKPAATVLTIKATVIPKDK